MNTQPEAILENNLVKQLTGLGYSFVHIHNEDCGQNLFQVTNQVAQEGTYKNRYDVTLLVNGLPLVQIELKRRGLELKEAFNQINRYKRHSFWTNSGLFQYVQIFVISNGVNTKYYVNNPLTTLSFKQTFYWADVYNKNITDAIRDQNVLQFSIEYIGRYKKKGNTLAAEPKLLYKASHSREKLDDFIADYNAMYNTSFSTKDGQQYENYFKDISKRIKDREKVSFNEKDRVDILLVVNMFLTEQKSHGNILCFRNLKYATDEAIALFSNKDAKDVILLPPYEDIVRRFSIAFADLLRLAPTVKSVDDLKSEEDELEFIQAFRALMRVKNVLGSFSDFNWEDLPMSEQSFEDYKSKYLDLYDKVKSDHQKEKASILEDVDFELELIHRDEVNVAYILKLLAKLKQTEKTKHEQQKKAIIDLLAGEIELRSKRELIEKFIEENLPQINDVDAIPDEFATFWNDQKILAISKLCEEEDLDKKQFQSLIDTYIYSEQEPLRDDVFKCLDNRPSVLKAREIGERIINKMKEFVEVFIRGVAA